MIFRIASVILAGLLPLLFVGAAGQTPRQPGELRCGWYANPTPGNHWLTDRDRTWTLMTQGSRGAPGMDNLPDMTTIDWQRVNGHYGYGCACIRMTVNARTGRVTRIYSGRPIPIRRCEQDRALRRP